MEIQTVSQVSKFFGVSTRMLRYYEQNSLITSQRQQDYAYRVYDRENIKRIQQIIILRKLQVPIKQIKIILDNPSAVEVIKIFEENIAEMDEQITALSTIKEVLARFIEQLQEKADVKLNIDLLNDTSIVATVNSLSFSHNKIKENVKVEEIGQASATLSKFDKVSYQTLAPMRTVAFNAISREPEDEAMAPIFRWIKENNLEGTARYFLFNVVPFPEQTSDGTYGMGCCATIPENIEISKEFYELCLPGGDYVTTLWKDTDTPYDNIWALLGDESWEWERDWNRPNHPLSGLEEHISTPNGGFIIQAMLPIKKKEAI